MENQANSKNIILNYGLYLGVAGVFIHLLFYASGSLFENLQMVGLIGLIPMIALIVLGIRKFKFDNGGFLSFGQALKVGVGIAVVSALISTIYTLIFTNVIEPTYQDQLMEIQKQAWLDGGLSDEQIESAEAMTKKFQSPFITVPIAIVVSAFFGFIISAITGAIMQKKEEDTF
ncbi:DUF4199 domain-containing protein [Tenacibaculum sp. MEBiC06402]|uniref:DUF4199 domain-containing protein n=1 Tax=unclassified Tenacibaculum TaxID=2635139 RepID=UPI003B9D822F